jgi:hypothetical protein
MSERDPNRILLDDTDIITAFDIWFEGEMNKQASFKA